jgi:hypothetical protein
MLSISPRRVRAGRMTRFAVSVFGADCKGCSPYPVKGAKVRFGGRNYKVNASGQARFKRRFKRSGRLTARATRRGYRSTSLRVRVFKTR